MDYISLGILGLTILTILIGFLLGLTRGLKRSVLRTVILLVCIVGAYFLKSVLVGTIKTIKVGEGTIDDTIMGLFTGNELLSKVEEQMTVIIQCLMEILVYIVSLLILQFLSWIIIYPICKIFVKKPDKKHKKKLLGGIVGAVAGAVMCIAIISPLSGLIGNVSSLVTSVGEVGNLMESETAEIKNETFSIDKENSVISLYGATAYAETEEQDGGFGEITEVLDNIGITKFNDSFIAKTYTSVGGWYYDLVSTVKTKDGKTTNFNTQIGALNGAIRLASNVLKIKDMQFDKIFQGEEGENIGSMENLENLMAELDNIKASMSKEQMETLTDMIQNTVTVLLPQDVQDELGIDFENFDISKINFTNEAKLFSDFSLLAEEGNTPSGEEIEGLINGFAESTIMINVIKAADAEFIFDKGEVTDAEIVGYIEGTNASPDIQEALAKMFNVALPA